VHVVAPHGRGRRDLTTEQLVVRVHESLYFGADAIHPLRSPRQQRVAKAAVDAAADASSDAECRALLGAVVQQRLVRAADLRPPALANPTLAHRELILETIGDVEGGSESLPEIEWSRGIRRFGLPAPRQQRRVRHPDGHYYLDADFEPWLVTVEINGSQHLTMRAREADDERRFMVSIGGRFVVDISSYLVRHHIDRAVLRTARALHFRGWQPDPTATMRLGRAAESLGQPLWLPPLMTSAVNLPA
jgi:hypothetical protein